MEKTEKIVAIDNAKLKLLKWCLVTIMYSAKVLRFFSSTSNPGNMEPSDISAKCDEILRFRWIRFNMPQGFMRIPC